MGKMNQVMGETIVIVMAVVVLFLGWRAGVIVGSIVLVRLPADAAALAAQRGYLPAHIPLLKRVGAVAP